MKNKRKLVIIIAGIALAILLFPIRLSLKDGGSKVYRSMVGSYEVQDWNQMCCTEDGSAATKTGITIKLFGGKVFDNTKTLSSDSLGAIDTVNFPTTMSADEMLAKAKEEGFVVTEEFRITSGEDTWQEFFRTTNAGNPAVVYLAHYYTLGDESRYDPEYYKEMREEYPKIFLVSLAFDGEKYTITERPGYMEETEMIRTYPHLVKYEGKPASATALFDRYEYYVLVHDKNVTWKELEWGMFSSQMGDYIDHYRVVSKHIME